MIRKFNQETYTWDGVDTLVYKQDNSPFKDVTRQVLFDGAWDIPCQFRYFEVQPGGYSTAYAYGDDLPWKRPMFAWRHGGRRPRRGYD